MTNASDKLIRNIDAPPPRAGITGSNTLPQKWVGHPRLGKNAPDLSKDELEESAKMGLDIINNDVDLLTYRHFLETSLHLGEKKG